MRVLKVMEEYMFLQLWMQILDVLRRSPDV